MTATLRLARVEDIPALDELIPLSARGLQIEDYSPAQIEGALGTIFAVDSQLIADRTFFVAEEDGVIVGCGGWSRRKTLFGGDRAKREPDTLLDPERDAARIRAFFIHPQYARRGIGRRIMEASEAAAHQAGFRSIEIVATLTGEPLYASFGYQVVDRFDIPLENGEHMPVVRMAKQ